MRTRFPFALAAIAILLSGLSAAVRAGGWRDHFHLPQLQAAWAGDRSAFQIVEGRLEGRSASPVAQSPLNVITVAAGSADYTAGCWVSIMAPNSSVCTKGALILRQNGTNGYVFALHQATQTVEVYTLGARLMLLAKPAKIELRAWHYLRAELSGPEMRFFVDGEWIGTVTDPEPAAGGAGLAVQDANAVAFDDFSMEGPGVAGNVDGVIRPDLAISGPGEGGMTLRFEALPGYDYRVQSALNPSGRDWQTLTNFRSKLVPFEALVPVAGPSRMEFYRVEKLDCNCD